jgi:iron(III) transport system substrate-binding protein
VPARISGKAPPFGCIFRRTAAVHWQNDEIEGRDERTAHGGKSMMGSRISRRDVLIGSSALAAGAAFSTTVMSAAPPAMAVTPALIEAAKKEGKVVWYTSVDLKLSEQIGKAFEAKYPGVTCKVERTGAERLLQRIGQEYTANVHAVDVVNSSDASHLVYWKDQGMLSPYVPEDVAKFYPADHKDVDGMFASFRVFLCVIAYNTNLVKKEEAPKSFADLLDPKWKGKIIKAHPGYSGTIMTATYQVSRDLGWSYFEKLAQQNILQVQSAADPPKKLALGERAIQADGVEYLIFQEKEKGQPVEPVYATEGTPIIIGPNGVFKAAPNPNAARLFQSFCFSPECQKLAVEIGGLRSVHPQVPEHQGRTPLSKIKLMKDDAAAVLKNSEQIKARYVKIFRV